MVRISLCLLFSGLSLISCLPIDGESATSTSNALLARPHRQDQPTRGIRHFPRQGDPSADEPEPDSEHADTTKDDGPEAADNEEGSYKLADMYKGADFLDPEQWEFFEGEDPTKGQVNYQTVEKAKEQKLAFVSEDESFWMVVDHKNDLDLHVKRNSTRISSKKKYNEALVIADIEQMPYGCSVWPAWWTVGDNWPEHGEIDLLEGVHNQEVNQYTYHTRKGCTVDESVKMTAELLSPQCAVGGDLGNNGCGMKDTGDAPSYGEGFNLAKGGVIAHVVDKMGIRIWFFPRDRIPDDITQNSPNPSKWSTPASFLANGEKCNVPSFFVDHVLTFDTTLCGEWAGDEKGFENAGCPGTCEETVMDPKNFEHAKWKVKYVAVYSNGGTTT